MKKNHDNKIIAIYRRNHPSLESVDSILSNQRKRNRETSHHRQGISISEADDMPSANVSKKRKMITFGTNKRTKQPNASVSSKESTKRSHASMLSKNKETMQENTKNIVQSGRKKKKQKPLKVFWGGVVKANNHHSYSR